MCRISCQRCTTIRVHVQKFHGTHIGDKIRGNLFLYMLSSYNEGFGNNLRILE